MDEHATKDEITNNPSSQEKTATLAETNKPESPTPKEIEPELEEPETPADIESKEPSDEKDQTETEESTSNEEPRGKKPKTSSKKQVDKNDTERPLIEQPETIEDFEGLDSEQLKKKKDYYQEKANQFKQQRDELHTFSKKLAKERDEYNARIRQLRNQVNDHKKKRDEYNERVQHAKEQRNDIIKNHIELKKEIRRLQKSRSSNSGVNISKLKQNLRKLETDQMTQALTPQKERKLVETMRDLHDQIKEAEGKLQKDPKLKQAIDEEKDLKDKAERKHEAVEGLAKKAQQEHQDMIEILKELDNLQKRTTEIQEKIVETKIKADGIHRDFIT